MRAILVLALILAAVSADANILARPKSVNPCAAFAEPVLRYAGIEIRLRENW